MSAARCSWRRWRLRGCRIALHRCYRWWTANPALNCIAHVVGHGPLLFLYVGVHDEHANWLVSKLALQEPRLIARQRNQCVHDAQTTTTHMHNTFCANRLTRYLLLNRTHMFLNDACSKKRHGTCVRQRHDDQVHEHACLLSQMQHASCVETLKVEVAKLPSGQRGNQELNLFESSC